MKRLSIFLLTTLLFTSCDSSPVVDDKGNEVVTQSDVPSEEIPAVKRLQTTSGYRIKVYTFDGCEYVCFLHGANSSWGAHKGDCKNPIHVYNRN